MRPWAAIVGVVALAALVVTAARWTGGTRPPAPPPLAPGAQPSPVWDVLVLARRDAVAPVVRQEAYGEVRASLALTVPREAAFPVTVPPGAVLDFGYAVQSHIYTKDVVDLAAPTRFRVVLHEDAGAEHVLVDRVVDIRGRASDRRWFDTRVDLAPYAGARGRLAFSVTTDEASGQTIALFSAPRILTAPAQGDANLLLITIDCLRADHVGAYGYGPPTTPTLDALAAQGIRFTHAYSTAPMTLPSLPQLFTSTLFPVPGLATFVGPVNAAGIPSAAFVHNVWLMLWLTSGRGLEAPDAFDTLVQVEARGSALTDQALGWLDAHPGTRFALYLHYLDAHSPFAPRSSYAGMFRDPAYTGRVGTTFDAAAVGSAEGYGPADRAAVAALYDAGVRYVDDQVKRILDALARDGRLERTVIVVTADHGEEFGEHGGFFHGQSLHDELLHVPLLVRLPGAARAGTVVDRQVRALDLAPALVDWLGLPRPATFLGRGLADAIAHPDDAPDDAVATAVMAQFPTRYALRTPGFKLIDDVGAGRISLYDLAHDPQEEHDVLPEHEREAEPLRSRLAAARAPLRERGFTVRIVGPETGVAGFRLTLTNAVDVETFATLDRIDGAPGAAVAHLAPNGRGLDVEGRVDASGVAFRFDRPSGGAGRVLEVTPVLAVDGAPAGEVRLGADGHAPPNGRFVLDAALDAPQPPPCAAPPTGVRVCVWRVPTGAPAAPAAPPSGPAATDPAVRERLRALGYVQ
jgi:arylsulfatase